MPILPYATLSANGLTNILESLTTPYIWYDITLPLTRLSWELQSELYDQVPMFSIIWMLEMIAKACPELVALEISKHHLPALFESKEKPSGGHKTGMM